MPFGFGLQAMAVFSFPGIPPREPAPPDTGETAATHAMRIAAELRHGRFGRQLLEQCVRRYPDIGQLNRLEVPSRALDARGLGEQAAWALPGSL
jgi:hypothetical protein